jgi:preprotein translocase subunit SecE
VQFFVEVWMELRRAEWPTRKESFRLTGIVIALAAAIAVALGIIDFVFNLLGRSFLG